MTHLSSAALQAVAKREAYTTLHNRFVQVFALVMWGSSTAVAVFTGNDASVPFAVLLLWLYIIPLFALLIGVHTVHEERDEQPFLLSQPVPRDTFVIGKLAMLVALITAVLAGALVPVAIVAPGGGWPLIFGLGLALALIGVSVGLAIGHYARSSVRGLMGALLLWFVGLVLYDFATLALVDVPFIHNRPALWIGVLLLNPLDAVRLAGLMGLEAVPFTVPGAQQWVEPLLNQLPLWVAALTVGWTAAATTWARRQLNRHDVQ